MRERERKAWEEGHGRGMGEEAWEKPGRDLYRSLGEERGLGGEVWERPGRGLREDWEERNVMKGILDYN